MMNIWGADTKGELAYGELAYGVDGKKSSANPAKVREDSAINRVAPFLFKGLII
jgi:hypothetical protein